MPTYIHEPPYTLLLTYLSSHLPRSGPLFRRIQHHINSPSPSSTARVLASFSEEENLIPDSGAKQPWIIAYTDIHRGPDTQVWVFSSLESKPKHAITEPERRIAKSQLLSFFTFIRTHLVPPYLDWVSSTQPVHKTEVEETGVKKIPPHPLPSVLLGSVHELVIGLIVELAGEEKRLRIHRGQNVFYAKYCFPSSSFEHEDVYTKQLEELGYTFTDSIGRYGITERHIPLVKSRTNIPRSTEALLAMGGVALFHSSPSPSRPHEGPVKQSVQDAEEMPIAWAFLGFDGSLSSLHVEPEHRGRGLAVAVGREVMKRGVNVFGPSYTFLDLHSRPHSNSNGNSSADLDSKGDRAASEVRLTSALDGSTGAAPELPVRLSQKIEEEWFFADVAVGNTASRRVMEKMGGKALWDVAWIVVEVEVDN
ncbi:hypothetical protein AN6353.2 [Aspergillus nidulans FGSC A4]|uniref:Acetyltransferase, GNAT family family (AFU_orthologue AFUA_3G07750) n=1 Tax=Emericella nidulans (strain FGSC A4 / ATCC 38163 / CBS 112.46 / NRRL 194 / M139) TaxID=227321 RepID=Q5AZC7_EMENI|nr:hypothetical protein [Aspergillus nidulans FGSC A4]EAA58737.1 hypothetical protein AN6353.2 [Aspergillus nidulans FGSC A4]CBF69640.1 TPA: acetyltransferase, GNAT family family (AFU_orthologue; AFUA_3G07750) [Aspergillus nidulans FGSC A4]|eukprot:XP_663957.1 hypothetical protein AN6353.2 [Aspergillus nidulans FGSC A4]